MTELDARRLRKNIFCNNCGRLYQRKHSLESHTCDSLSKTELTKTRQDIQEMTVSKKDQNKNDTAEESISTFEENTKISQFEEQIESNSAEKKYICNDCGKTYQNKHDLKSHTKVHNWIDCDFCDKSFSTWEKINRHIKSVYEYKRNHQCTSCGKSFLTARDLRIHIRTVHDGQKDYKCDTCGENFGLN